MIEILVRVTTIEDGVTTVRTNEPDPAPVTQAHLLDCTREELAMRIIELTAELDRERAGTRRPAAIPRPPRTWRGR